MARSFLSRFVFVLPLIACSEPSAPATGTSDHRLIPTGNLVAHWKLDESSGSTAADATGNGFNGTLSSTPTWTAGKVNGGLSFNGTDSVQIGNIAPINGVQKATLAAWIKKNSSGSRILIGKQVCCLSDFAIEAWSDGALYFQASHNNESFGSTPLSDTAWHHVALVFDGALSGNANRLKAYVDGTQRTLSFTGTVPTQTTTNTTPFRFGQMLGDFSDGLIDEVVLYSRALSAAEIQQLYQHTGSPPDTEPPSTPDGLGYTSTMNSVSLSWTAASDNVGVVDYRVFRNGVAIGTVTGTSRVDTGLSPGTTYSYTVTARDAAGNESPQSAPLAATTASDTTPPAVSITTPAPGTVVSGNVTITAAASDDVGVASVEFLVDGVSLGAPDSSAPYSAVWNAGAAANGPHVLSARALDTASNTRESAPVSVTVNNQLPDQQPPSVPAGLSASAGPSSVSLAWQASSDDVGVAGYRIYKGSTLLGTSETTSFVDHAVTQLFSYSYEVSAIRSDSRWRTCARFSAGAPSGCSSPIRPATSWSPGAAHRARSPT